MLIFSYLWSDCITWILLYCSYNCIVLPTKYFFYSYRSGLNKFLDWKIKIITRKTRTYEMHWDNSIVYCIYCPTSIWLLMARRLSVTEGYWSMVLTDIWLPLHISRSFLSFGIYLYYIHISLSWNDKVLTDKLGWNEMTSSTEWP